MSKKLGIIRLSGGAIRQAFKFPEGAKIINARKQSNFDFNDQDEPTIELVIEYEGFGYVPSGATIPVYRAYAEKSEDGTVSELKFS